MPSPSRPEYIISEHTFGFGVWIARKDWRQNQPLECFLTKQEAEEYEYMLKIEDVINE